MIQFQEDYQKKRQPEDIRREVLPEQWPSIFGRGVGELKENPLDHTPKQTTWGLLKAEGKAEKLS